MLIKCANELPEDQLTFAKAKLGAITSHYKSGCVL